MIKTLLTLALFACELGAADKIPDMSQAQLDRTVSHWQHTLMLEDWEIRAHFVTLDDLEEGTIGSSRRNFALRYMAIRVLAPSEYAAAAVANHTVPKTGKEIARDIEDTVVHELVHLRLIDLMQADNKGLADAEELTVNRITAALLYKKSK